MASREGRDAWFFLTSKYGSKRRLFTLDFWRSEYVWHDTFGKRWNRWIGCHFRGHKLMNISEVAGQFELHCFHCETTFKELRP